MTQHHPLTATRPRRWQPLRHLLTLCATAVLALATSLALVAPSQAHGGPLSIELGTNASGGIEALVTWAQDGHPVEESVDLTLTAVSDDGQEVGPVPARSAPEGIGWYTSDPDLLGPGHWSVTATTTTPSEHEVTVGLDVVPAPTPQQDDAAGSGGGDVDTEAQPETESAAEAEAESAAQTPDVEATEDASTAAGHGTSSPAGWIVAGALALALVVTLAWVAWQRRQNRHA